MKPKIYRQEGLEAIIRPETKVIDFYAPDAHGWPNLVGSESFRTIKEAQAKLWKNGYKESAE